jgi:hypothetical protein
MEKSFQNLAGSYKYKSKNVNMKMLANSKIENLIAKNRRGVAMNVFGTEKQLLPVYDRNCAKSVNYLS